METIDIMDTGFNIFIKKGPEIFDEKKAKEIADQADRDMKNSETLSNSQFFNNMIQNLYRLGQSKGQVDYSGCNTFWVVDETEPSYGQGITLVEKDNASLKKSFKNIDELNEKFMDLREFLDDANYIGRYFKRTAKIDGRDISFMEEDNSTLVLFATDNQMLIQTNDSSGKEFKMLSSRYFEDGNFEYYGEQHDEYNDKEAVFHAIEKQLTKGRRNML